MATIMMMYLILAALFYLMAIEEDCNNKRTYCIGFAVCVMGVTAMEIVEVIF